MSTPDKHRLDDKALSLHPSDESGVEQKRQRFGFRSLQFRIFSLFFLLLLVLQSYTAYLVYRSILDDFDKQSYENLQVGQQLFNEERKNNDVYLGNTVRTIAKDWAFRSAVGQQDRATIISVLANHSHRISADYAQFLPASGGRISIPESLDGFAGVIPMLPEISDQGVSFYSYFNGDLIQFVVEPVKAPLFLGWLVMGFSVDQDTAKDLSRLTSLDVSFVFNHDNQLDIIATPLAPTLQDVVASDLTLPLPTDTLSMVLGGDDYLIRGFALEGSDGQVQVLLSQRLKELRAGFESVWDSLVLLLAIGSLLSIMLAYRISQSIANPVRRLLEAAADIASGNYGKPITIDRQDEIGSLSMEFNRMQSAVKQREEELRFRTTHDDLTPFLNRTGFLDAVVVMINAVTECTVLTLDIEDFRQVNDTLGHSVGDQMIGELALRLQSVLDSSYRLARFGGGQFAMLIQGGEHEAQQLCAKVTRVLEPAFELDGVKIYTNVIKGFAVYPVHAEDAESLLRKADIALDQSKQYKKAAYGDHYGYDPSNDQNTVFRLSLLHELRDGISNGRMELYYQPKLQLSALNGKSDNQGYITQVECLVRMNHSDGHRVFPDQFIPLAESSGVIVELTEWLIDTALQQCALMREQQVDLVFAINISAIDLTAGRLPKRISQLLSDYQLPPDVLVLEITESAVAEDPEQALMVMNELRAIGLSMSIDDYGTGYSSLAQMKQIPAAELKIDRAFVMNVIDDREDQLIVRSTIDMGHGLGLKVTAEGVEDAATLTLLEEMGCDFAQGYYIAKPMPAVEFHHWLVAGDYPYRKLDS